jgi:hypothetical protein
MIVGIDIRAACGQKAGIGTHFYELVHNVAKVDLTNTYYLYCREPFEFREDLPNNIRIIRLNVPLLLWHPMVSLHARLRHVKAFLTSSNITALFLRRNQLILHIPDMSGIVLKNFHTYKVIALSKLYHFVARKARFINTTSSFSREEIALNLKVNRDKIFVTALATSPAFRRIDDRRELDHWKKSLTLPPRFILFVGSIEPRKNIMGILNALLRMDLKSRPTLVIAGGHGWKNSDVFNYVKKYKLGDNVCILGYVSREALVALYNLAEVFIFPSFYEGFGLPVLEAFACGTPVIASNVSSIPEVAGDAALLIDPHNVEEIANAISKVLQDPVLRDQMVHKGAAQLKNFSWEKNAIETVSIFNRIKD